MARLSLGDLEGRAQKYEKEISLRREPIAVNKAELRQAIDGVDQGLDDNLALINSWFPVSVRSKLTPKQKTEILVYVVEQRYRVT